MSTKTREIKDLFQSERELWIRDCQSIARKLLLSREEITIEDVLRECPRPQFVHKNTTGNVFRHPDFLPTGFTLSRRAISNGRVIRKWTLNTANFPEIVRNFRRQRLGYES